MPPEKNTPLDAVGVSPRFSKTQVAGTIVAVSGAVYAIVNLGEHPNMQAVSGGCVAILLWGLTTLVGSIMRAGWSDDTVSRDVLAGSSDETNDLTGEEATQIENLFWDGHDVC